MQENQFKDSVGNIWTIKITVSEFMKLREDLGIDIGNIFDGENSWITKLIQNDDMGRFLEILLALTERERESNNITRDAFFDALEGDVLDHAMTAMIEGIINFIPVRKRSVLRTMITTMENGIDKATEKYQGSQQMLDEKIEKVIDEAIQKTLKS